MRKFELELLEISFLFVISLATILLQPKLPLLCIPFALIIALRTIFGLLGDKQ
jgi:hypothetical protein